jgi:hypothetical protein
LSDADAIVVFRSVVVSPEASEWRRSRPEMTRPPTFNTEEAGCASAAMRSLTTQVAATTQSIVSLFMAATPVHSRDSYYNL